MGGNASSWRGRRNGHQWSQRNRHWRRIGCRRAICKAAGREGSPGSRRRLQADRGATLAEEIGGVFASVDVTKTEQIEAAVETWVRRLSANCSLKPFSDTLIQAD